MFMYQKKMPRLMNEKKMVSNRMPNEGAFQMLKGKMGSFANLISQNAKAPIWMKDAIRRTIMYGELHPAIGAWLASRQCPSSQ